MKIKKNDFSISLSCKRNIKVLNKEIDFIKNK